MDLLFLHTPKFHNYYKPIGEFSFILFPPIGLLGLADFLNRNGRTAQIIHLGVEDYLRGPLNLDRLVRENQPSIVGLDLHWHFQSYDVIEVARKIKQAHPEVGILLGGFTASIFADEILRSYPFVDFVIRGDAEIPVLELVRRFTSDKDYAAVANLTYRKNNEVVSNAQNYVADSAMLDSMCFTDFRLMKDSSTFIQSFSRYVRLPNRSEVLQRKIFSSEKWFPVVLGRGCAFECFFCGGSREAHRHISGRTKIAVRSAKAVVASISELDRLGFTAAGLWHDCHPAMDADAYYIEIFEQLKSRQISIDIHLERYALPGRPFLESFRRLPGRNSSISLSVHTPNEALRRQNGVYRYSNEEMEKAISQMESMGIPCVLFFSCGLPYESKDDLEQTARYQRELKRKFEHLAIRTSMIEIEPGSPMSRKPEGFGILPHRTTFADFYSYHAKPQNNHFLAMGYERCGLPSQDDVAHFYCTHFCERLHAGRFSPYICNGLEGARKLGALTVFEKALALKQHN